MLDPEGNALTVKVISEVKSFFSYEEAEAFVAANPDHVIAGSDRFISPVPLEKLEHYRLVHQSPSVAVRRGDDAIHSVQVYEYLP